MAANEKPTIDLVGFYNGLISAVPMVLYTVPAGQSVVIENIYAWNRDTAPVSVWIGKNQVDDPHTIVPYVAVPALPVNNTLLWSGRIALNAGETIISVAGADAVLKVFIEGHYGEISAGTFGTDGRWSALHSTDGSPVTIDAIGGMTTNDIQSRDLFGRILRELGRLRRGMEILVGQEIAPEDVENES